MIRIVESIKSNTYSPNQYSKYHIDYLLLSCSKANALSK